ncbi:hypothetical protein LOD99_1417 [Oopsacas minuta]|uniref:Uncharacterized protein n=1 Tax=Oopsacas minuta TaxID=111878 RepID=A0AAV7K5N9_9METZ|nr:hypothetical protein LOD99_1417 [Oopsacas minuta]
MKQFIKSLDKDGPCFKYICRSFPGMSNEKLKAGIFDGPQIRSLIRNSGFVQSMTNLESSAWCAFVFVVNNFLDVNMSIKVHYLFSHLDRFPENLGDLSEEQGERFHQDIKVIEERYQGRWDTHMMADYCWSLQRDCPLISHNRKSNKRLFLDVLQ